MSKKKDPAQRLEGAYRVLFMEGMHREACNWGLYRTVLPPDEPDPESQFFLAVRDMLQLLNTLPRIQEGDSLATLQRKIRTAQRRCKSDLVKSIPEANLFRLMKTAKERAVTYKPGRDELYV